MWRGLFPATIFVLFKGAAISATANDRGVPTMPHLTNISAEEAHTLVAGDAVLVDVREPYELAMERIEGAIAAPLSQLARGESLDLPKGKRAVFLCASGMRTTTNSADLADLAGGDAYNMVGGINAWKRAGFGTVRG
jgi:rhodanese-related sulfurtransferase